LVRGSELVHSVATVHIAATEVNNELFLNLFRTANCQLVPFSSVPPVKCLPLVKCLFVVLWCSRPTKGECNEIRATARLAQ